MSMNTGNGWDGTTLLAHEIAKRYGRLARSKLFGGLFPGVHTYPATLFELDGWPGNKLIAARSGTVIDKTSHMAALLMRECAHMTSMEVQDSKTRPVGVTIAELHHVPPLEEYPAQFSTLAPFYACVPILVSLITCAMCLLVNDWYSFSMICSALSSVAYLAL
ncbi:hypothetical protein EDC04DRAFT_881876 [Pisolithus marmoratus]|nr:hypothetical protein EDC04DRAFT_881876 [Pisolithus marmoratus]